MMKYLVSSSAMFTKKFLSAVRCQALRKRVWFRALDAIERGILSLSARVIENVKSSVLYHQLASIVEKLGDACKSDLLRHFERFGMDRLRVIRSQALRFGYKEAGKMNLDLDFVKYLMFLDYNQPIGWRIYGS